MSARVYIQSRGHPSADVTPAIDTLARWPLDTEDWPRTVLVGALLVATLPFVVPGVLLAGYAVRVLRVDVGDDPLPRFTDIRALAETGVRATGIVAAYHLPAVALVAIGTRGAASASVFLQWETLVRFGPSAVGRLPGLAALAGAVGVGLLGAALLPLCGYVSTVAVTAYADTDTLADAFALGRIRRRVFSAATLRAWLLASLAVLGSGVGAFLVATAATPIPGVGRIATAAVRFYGLVVGLAVWTVTRPTRECDGASASDMEVGENAATPST
ncbi:Protein of unknown function [Haloplanus vescus]|uniref:DUF4013 domain-containing protein n=1 Tax=Haloplanus vescus TaxID=555874 RepID=A0A1H3WV69_9EURY|nr:Protein of unknown function [Haloplanus vescus]